ncbi:MAG TPA: PDZ domain-containing protein [Bacteroidota bacterium]
MNRLLPRVLLTVFCSLTILNAQEMMQRQVQLNPNNGRVLPEVGIVLRLGEGDKQPTVAHIIGALPKGATFEEGDVILTVNKKKVATLKEFDKAYEAVKVGATVEFEIERDGKKMTLSYKKPKPEPGKPMIIQRHN